jgi:hypothetical protein
MPDMATCAQFEPVAWWWTKNQIGQDLRKLYEVPKELSPKLLALVRKLDAVEGNQLSPRSRTLLKKLDAIEGNYLRRNAPPAEPRSVDSSDDWSLCT